MSYAKTSDSDFRRLNAYNAVQTTDVGYLPLPCTDITMPRRNIRPSSSRVAWKHKALPPGTSSLVPSRISAAGMINGIGKQAAIWYHEAWPPAFLWMPIRFRFLYIKDEKPGCLRGFDRKNRKSSATSATEAKKRF
uniref:Uncharacterized protein n=1 Tax=Moniliophthora roreri TaxID=221103 RepID=A0A0W0GDU3_MONRR